MPKLQMGIGHFRLFTECSSVRRFGFRQMAGLLQRMAVLNPDGRIAGIAVEKLSIVLRGDLPLPGVPLAVGAGDQAWRGSTPKPQHLSSASCPPPVDLAPAGAAAADPSAFDTPVRCAAQSP